MASNYYRNWWLLDNGRNGLKGVDGDDSNPPVLTDEEIAYGLRTSRYARNDYNKLYPDLLADEKTRLDEIIADNPRLTALMLDSMDFHDQVQSKHNKTGVRLEMPRR